MLKPAGFFDRNPALDVARFKTPVLATVIIGVIASIGVWLYTFGSSSVVDSFDTVVSVDGLLFALYYALTGIATAVYYRKLARTSMWNIIHIAVFPLAAAGFLAYIVVRSVEGRRGDHALRAVHGRIGLLQPAAGNLPARGCPPARKPRAVTVITMDRRDVLRML